MQSMLCFPGIFSTSKSAVLSVCTCLKKNWLCYSLSTDITSIFNHWFFHWNTKPQMNFSHQKSYVTILICNGFSITYKRRFNLTKLWLLKTFSLSVSACIYMFVCTSGHFENWSFCELNVSRILELAVRGRT